MSVWWRPRAPVRIKTNAASVQFAPFTFLQSVINLGDSFAGVSFEPKTAKHT
jgi:hypothetical protein